MTRPLRTGVLALGLMGLALGMADAATAYTGTAATLRRTPAVQGRVLGVVPSGMLLTVACSGEWCRTSYRGQGGYVARSTLRSFTRSAPVSGVFYASCAAMRAQGRAPVNLGQPGFRSGLDSNRNAVACDPGDR